jgi:hypothetical protein
MRVVRDVTLELREQARHGGRVLRLRVLLEAGVYDLRGEDEAGNLHFRYQDQRVFCVMQEFESTLSELLGDYRAVAGPAAAHG